MSSDVDAEGYLLLTIPEATVSQVFEGEKMQLGRGELAVECVTLPIPRAIGHQTANPFATSPNDPPPTHDMWLILRIGDDFEHTLVPGNPLQARSPPGGDGGPTYTIRNPDIPGAELDITLEAPRSVNELQDMGTLESLFKQYGALPQGSGLDGVQSPSLGETPTYGDSKSGFGAPVGQPPSYASTEGAGQSSFHGDKHSPATGVAAGSAAAAVGMSTQLHGGGAEDLRGKLVLVDETTGAVIGEMDQEPKMSDTEAADVANQEPTRPVMIDFGPIVANTREVRVTRLAPEELDGWMLKSADKISRGVLGASSAASGAMLRSAERYRAKTVPRPEPVRMGAVTSSLKTVHGATSAGARVTGSTVHMINNTVERLVSKKQKGGPVYAAPHHSAASSTDSAPQKSTFTQLKEAAAPAYDWAMNQAQQRGYISGSSASGTNEKASTNEKAGSTPGLGAGPPLPPRQPSPGYNEKPTTSSTYYADEKTGHSAPLSPAGSTPASGTVTPSGKRKKRPLLNRTLLAADVVLSSLEVAANELVTSGTQAASTAVGALYGNEAGAAVAYTGASVRNAVLVYIDVRGVARRSIFKATAKGYIKARMKYGDKPTYRNNEGYVVVSVPAASEKK
ncbi:hypothetical protein CspeluHIS016_0407230 [Cutaneotrichosporon spelunceum]|uniref:Senescence domain-containing protein n=1 Tax=Cutaneotrichosporon spelunceum TaxID=1672016 RepID=A0AAD3TWR2_9TREE|nr:hypothetical protein CspeluHIS016_0407230 [Cutaneotrichosporon spelunceum]